MHKLSSYLSIHIYFYIVPIHRIMLTNIYPEIHTILYMMRQANMLGVLISTLLTVTMSSITCVVLLGTFLKLLDKGTMVDSVSTDSLPCFVMSPTL